MVVQNGSNLVPLDVEFVWLLVSSLDGDVQPATRMRIEPGLDEQSERLSRPLWGESHADREIRKSRVCNVDLFSRATPKSLGKRRCSKS
jgi:hypothetical protein